MTRKREKQSKEKVKNYKMYESYPKRDKNPQKYQNQRLVNKGLLHLGEFQLNSPERNNYDGN